MKKVLSCFMVFNKNKRLYFMLLIYFFAQIIISGLASFVIPFFTNKVFAEEYFSRTFFICMSAWFIFAVVSSLIDYYGNRYNLKTYYRISEIQYEYQMGRFLRKGYEIARKMKVEEISSRLMRDTQMMTNIVIWVVGVLAMIVSFSVVLIWGCSIFPIVLLVFIPQCFISSLLKYYLDKQIAVVKDKTIKVQDEIKEYQHALNNGIELIREERFRKLLYQKIREQRKLAYCYCVKENVLRFLAEFVDYGFDVCAKVICILVFYLNGCFDGAIILPFFTVQATFRNQFLSCQDYISSIRQNIEAVKRVDELIHKQEPLHQAEETFACKLENVSVDFGNKMVLDRVNLSIKQGEKVAIVGENGSGKTTLLRVILGLITAKTGECVAKGCAYSPVNLQLFPADFSENISYLALKSEDATRQKNMLDASMLKKETIQDILGKSNMCQLSGGQQKIVSHLRALLSVRDMIIMDEPLAALDEEMAEYCIQFLKKYEGTLIVATHDKRVLDIVDRVVKIENGRCECA